MATVPSNLIPTRITQLPTAPVGATAATSQMVIVYNGNTYQINAGDIVSTTGVPTSRQVIAGTGMTGGGALAADVTLSIAPGGVGTVELDETGVSAGQYGSATTVPVFIVDVDGRITSVVEAPITVSGYVPTSREVIAGNGLEGGGALNNNITLTVNLTGLIPERIFQSGSAGTSTEVSRADHKHPAINLADNDEVNGLLGLASGGTARSLVADAGAIVWSGADGLYVGPVGLAGQVLVSSGTGEYTWGSALFIADQSANLVYAGPASGPDAPTAFRLMVNADLPNTTVTAGAYGSSSAFTTFTVNAKGVLTHASTVALNTVTVGNATNVAGGSVNKIVYQSSESITAFIDAPTLANTFLEWSGSAFQWSANPLGTVTSVAMTTPTGLSVSGTPITTNGTLALDFTAGYSLPTTVSQTNWDTAYSQTRQWDGGSTGLVAATGRTSLGLGTMATQAADNVAITGGSATLTSGNFSTGTFTWPTFNQNTTGTAGSVAHTLTRGPYLTGSNFNGSADTTWAVDADSANTASKIVVRDVSGNFAAGQITATKFVGIDGGTF